VSWRGTFLEASSRFWNRLELIRPKILWLSFGNSVVVMPSPITALVTIRYQWVRVAGLERLLMPLANNRNPSLTGTLVIPATRYQIEDSTFAEIVFSNSGLEIEGTVFVPKTEVVAIVKTADPEDMHKVGYEDRSRTEQLEETPIATTPVTDALPAQ
jgi:hypothetical protein